jgi:hypothetical protein
MDNTAKIIGYEIFLTKEEYDQAVWAGSDRNGNTDFHLGRVIAKAQARYITKEGTVVKE